MVRAVRLWLVWACSAIGLLGRTREMDRGLSLLRMWLSVLIWHTVSIRRRSLLVVVVSAVVVVWMSPLAASRLRNVGDHLHSTWDNARWAAATRGISRRGRASKSLGQLFDKGLTNIICSNVNCISNTKYDERTFCGKGQAAIRGIETGTRSFLDLTDTNSRLSDDGSYQNVWDK